MRGSAPATRTSKNVAAIEAIVAPRRESVAPDMFSSLRIASKIQESGRARTAAGSPGLRQDLGPLPARQRFGVARVVAPGAHSDRRDDRGGRVFVGEGGPVRAAGAGQRRPASLDDAKHVPKIG